MSSHCRPNHTPAHYFSTPAAPERRLCTTFFIIVPKTDSREPKPRRPYPAGDGGRDAAADAADQ
eukprot:6266775-Pyramimonas_sp.AAC.3